MAALFTFEVHTPYRLFYSGSVEAIVLTLLDGEAAIYANHSHFTAPVVPCLLKIKDKDGIWKTAFSSEGILEVTSHKTVLLTDTAEWPEEIDAERAKASRARAEETLKDNQLKFEAQTAAASLGRANMRLKARESEKL
jgi:F-type H+-transporting ATPase subunit epsilon